MTLSGEEARAISQEVADRITIRADLSKLSTIEMAILSVAIGKAVLVPMSNLPLHKKIGHLFAEGEGNSMVPISPIVKEEFDALKEERAAQSRASTFGIGDNVKVDHLALGDDRYQLADKIGVIVAVWDTPDLQYADVTFFTQEGAITLSTGFADLTLIKKKEDKQKS